MQLHSNPKWQSQQKQIRKQNQPCRHTVLPVHRIHDQSTPMAMAVQQTEHVINTVLYKYMKNTTIDVVLHVFDTTVI